MTSMAILPVSSFVLLFIFSLFNDVAAVDVGGENELLLNIFHLEKIIGGKPGQRLYKLHTKWRRKSSGLICRMPLNEGFACETAPYSAFYFDLSLGECIPFQVCSLQPLTDFILTVRN